ncbi:MAG TPA: cell division protein [Clostridiales bacterium]|nr:FtsW/RodA/SpoVE family cell cycle protein [Clostridia bacterium]HCS72789.1 cell division protein [Clostridiales bacterium]
MNGKQYDILALTLRYWFTLLMLYVFVLCAVRTLKGLYTDNPAQRSTGNIPFVLALFALTAFGLLALKDPESINVETALMGVLIAAVTLFQFYLFYFLFTGMDEVLLLIVNTLSITGFVMLQRLSPELALRQVEWFSIGSVVLFFIMLTKPLLKHLERIMYPLIILGPVILFFTAFFGEKSGGATSQLSVGGISFQPAEFVKIVFIIVLAYSLDTKKIFREKIPLFLFAASSILAVVLQKDLGSALQYFIVFIFVYQIATNDWLITIAASAAGVLASIFSYRMFSHVQVRVEAWKNPWADIGGKGWQVAQSLMAMGSGGLVGLGLGQGTPYIIPASRTDFIFAAICEEFGILTGVMIIGFYVMILIRGMQKAYRAQQASEMLLACGGTISLVIQAFIIIGGVVKMIPLTGITLPFVSYGGSSMLVSLTILGLIQSVSIKNYKFDTQEEYSEEIQVLEEDENYLIDDDET